MTTKSVSQPSYHLLPTPENDPTQQDRKRISEDPESLLFMTYDDYFNMEEELTPLAATTPEPDHSTSLQNDPIEPLVSSLQPPQSEQLSVSTDSKSFFFVLSGTSPATPSQENEYPPLSPLKSDDIPEALAYLLPQPSNSLLEVINVTQLESVALKEGNLGSSRSPLSTDHIEGDFHDRDDLLSLSSNHSATSSLRRQKHTQVRRRSSRESRRPPQLQLRDSTAAIPLSEALITDLPPGIPKSASAEISLSAPSPPKRRPLPNPIRVHDPPVRVTYYSGSSASSSEYSGSSLPSTAATTPRSVSSILGPRTKGVRSMNAFSPPPKPSQPVRSHVRGRSSPFPLPSPSPLPITYNFAPTSVPGSTRTPYSYF